MRHLALVLAALLAVQPAYAANFKPTGNLVKDLKDAAGQPQGSNEGGGTSGGGTQVKLCDANTIGNFDIKNLIEQIKICTSADAKAALDSATKANDSVATSCLTPVYALFQAIEGSQPPASATPDTSTPPANPPPVVLIKAGPLLIFQKFREFAISGGVAHCRSWVTTTLAAGAPLQ